MAQQIPELISMVVRPNTFPIVTRMILINKIPAETIQYTICAYMKEKIVSNEPL
jgi:hypothetical protein